MSVIYQDLSISDAPPKPYLNEISDRLFQARADDLNTECSGLTTDTYYYGGEPWYWPGGDEPEYYFELSPTESQILSTFCDEIGGTLIGVGTGRIAVRVEDLVIKFGRWGVSVNMGNGRKMNIRESSVFQQFGEATDAPLLPIYDYENEGRWEIQRYATPLAEYSAEEPLEHIQQELKQRLEDLKHIIHFDLNEYNIGVWQDDWYLIDFAKQLDDITANERQEIS